MEGCIQHYKTNYNIRCFHFAKQVAKLRQLEPWRRKDRRSVGHRAATKEKLQTRATSLRRSGVRTREGCNRRHKTGLKEKIKNLWVLLIRIGEHILLSIILYLYMLDTFYYYLLLQIFSISKETAVNLQIANKPLVWVREHSLILHISFSILIIILILLTIN